MIRNCQTIYFFVKDCSVAEQHILNASAIFYLFQSTTDLDLVCRRTAGSKRQTTEWVAYPSDFTSTQKKLIASVGKTTPREAWTIWACFRKSASTKWKSNSLVKERHRLRGVGQRHSEPGHGKSGRRLIKFAVSAWGKCKLPAWTGKFRRFPSFLDFGVWSINSSLVVMNGNASDFHFTTQLIPFTEFQFHVLSFIFLSNNHQQTLKFSPFKNHETSHLLLKFYCFFYIFFYLLKIHI